MSIINPGAYVTQGSAAKLDRYGNQSHGEVIKVLSVLRAFGERGYSKPD